MKVPCSVIQDLLPLYHDSVCSPESSAMIEEHLKDCESCQEEFHKLEESPLAENGKKEETEKENVQRMKNVKKFLHKKRVRVSVITAVVVVLLCIPTWFVMNLRFLAAKPQVLETVSVEEDTLTVTLNNAVWERFFPRTAATWRKMASRSPSWCSSAPPVPPNTWMPPSVPQRTADLPGASP